MITDPTYSFSNSGEYISGRNQFNLDASTLLGANAAIDNYLEQIKTISPEAYELFKIGSFEIDPTADVKVEVFGLGYGVTDSLTFYMGIPFYKATIDSRFKKVGNNNYNQVADILGQSGETVLNRLTEGLPDINEGVIQTVLTDHFNYSPLGRWSGEGIGDIEVGFMQKILQKRNLGALIKYGGILPTGRVNDPDILQDMSFGDGQLDVFLELAGGISLFPRLVEVNSSLRYTYQTKDKTYLRLADSSGKTITNNHQYADFKLGNKIDYKANMSLLLSDILKTDFTYLFNQTNQGEVFTDAVNVGRVLSPKSTQESLELKLTFSSVQPYLQGKTNFPPMDLSISYLKAISGKNTKDLSRGNLQLSLYF